MFSFLALVIVPGILAREITFPPVIGIQQSFGSDAVGEDLDLSLPMFNGLTTYAHTPYVHCLGKEDADVQKYDIAILGAPFDTVGSL